MIFICNSIKVLFFLT